MQLQLKPLIQTIKYTFYRYNNKDNHPVHSRLFLQYLLQKAEQSTTRKRMQSELCYQIVANLYRCSLNRKTQASFYTFAVKFDDKESVECTKKSPISQNSVEFSEEMSLKVSNYERLRTEKCEIVVFQYRDDEKRETVGKAAISVHDLNNKDKRRLRLVNNFAQCAIVQLQCYLRNVSQKSSYQHVRQQAMSGQAATLANLQSIQSPKCKQNQFTQIHLSTDTFLESQVSLNKIFSPNLSQFPETKLQSQQAQGSKRMEENNSSQFSLSKVESFPQSHQLKQTFRRKLKNQQKIVEKVDMLHNASDIDREKIQNVQNESFCDKNDTRVNKNLYFQSRIFSLNINSTVIRSLSIKSALIEVSVKSDHCRRNRIFVQREMNTQRKSYSDQVLQTQQVQTKSQLISTIDLLQQEDKSFQICIEDDQLNMKPLNGESFSSKTKFSFQNVSKSRVYNPQKQVNFQKDAKVFFNSTDTQSKQSIESSSLSATQFEGSSKQFFNAFDDKDKKLKQQNKFTQTMTSQMQSFLKVYQDPTLSGDQKSTLSQLNQLKLSVIHPIQEKDESVNESIQQTHIFKRQQQVHQSFQQQQEIQRSNIHDLFETHKKQLSIEKQIEIRVSSSREERINFSIQRNIEIAVSSLTKANIKDLWSRIKTVQNPQSRFQKVGYFPKDNKLSTSNNTIHEVNESGKQSTQLKASIKPIPPSQSFALNSTQNKDQAFSFLFCPVDPVGFQEKTDNNVEPHKLCINITEDNQHLEYQQHWSLQQSIFQLQDDSGQQKIDKSVESMRLCENCKLVECKFSYNQDKKNSMKYAENQHIQNSQAVQKANRFLQQANKKLTQKIKKTTDSFFSLKMQSQTNSVKKQKYVDVEKRLIQAEKNLKSIEEKYKQLLLDNETLEKQMIKSQQAAKTLHEEKQKISENFKLLMKKYHVLVDEYLEKEEKNRLTNAQTTSKYDCNQESGQKSIKRMNTQIMSFADLNSMTPQIKAYRTYKQLSENNSRPPVNESPIMGLINIKTATNFPTSTSNQYLQTPSTIKGNKNKVDSHQRKCSLQQSLQQFNFQGECHESFSHNFDMNKKKENKEFKKFVQTSLQNSARDSNSSRKAQFSSTCSQKKAVIKKYTPMTKELEQLSKYSPAVAINFINDNKTQKKL